MKTKESLTLYILRLALILLLITSLAAAVLAAVNSVTAPQIELLKQKKTRQAIESVLPGGGESVEFADDTGIVKTLYKGEAGYAAQVCPPGFNGSIDMMVGIDYSGKILGISIISHTETAGLGAVAAAQTSAGEAFRNQFIGMSGSVTVTKDGGQAEALTGATITSRAVCTGIRAALDCVEKLG